MPKKQQQSITEQLTDLEKKKEYLDVEEDLLMQKALRSEQPGSILSAQSYFRNVASQKGKASQKSYLFDPYQFYSSFGYKDKPVQITYNHLRGMARIPIVKSIVETRRDQIASYGEPVEDEQKKGWMIRKRKGMFEESTKRTELSKQDQQKIEYITNFLLNAGVEANRWHVDTFDTFLRKITKDTLEIDQQTFENVRNRKGELIEYLATDGATYRLADTYTDDADWQEKRISIDGYFPSYVQIYQGRPVTDFYPWELSFGIRNHSTNIYNNGYGTAELEDMVKIVTWLLYGDAYNGNFFSQGAAPKGILKVSGNINTDRLNEFRQQWQTMVAGVTNAWKTPVLEADKMEWVDLQKSNRDMEFSRWSEYLIKLACAIYKIDPSEIGFHLSGSSAGKQSLFQGGAGTKEKTDFSKEKGLQPLLKFTQRKIDRYLVQQIDPAFEFIFTGIDPEDEQKATELDIKKVTNFMTLNEVRVKRDLPKIKDGDIILNPAYLQSKQMAMMGSPESNEFVDEETGEAEGNMYKESPFEETEKGSNPILDDLNGWIDQGMLNN